MQALDPPFGMTGSAAAGVPLSRQPRGRAEERHKYPIIPCADGFVRICVLARGSGGACSHGWAARRSSPTRSSTTSFTRFARPALLPAIARFFADRTRAELEAAGPGVRGPHRRACSPSTRRWPPTRSERAVLPRGRARARASAVPIPDGVVEIDGAAPSRTRRHGAAAAGGLSEAHARTRPQPRARPGRLPLEGIRVLDLGVIVVGGDTGRLFGDLGADVIKVENRRSSTARAPPWPAGYHPRVRRRAPEQAEPSASTCVTPKDGSWYASWCGRPTSC